MFKFNRNVGVGLGLGFLAGLILLCLGVLGPLMYRALPF